MKKYIFDVVPGSIQYTEQPHHARHVSGLVAGRPSGTSCFCQFQIELSLVDATDREAQDLQLLLERIGGAHKVSVEAI